MTSRALEILAFCIVVLIATLAFHAWLSAHDDQLRLQSVVASQKQVLDAADSREHDRSATLKDALAQIETLKRQTQTPEQILRDLPKYLHLPQPITLSPAVNAGDGGAESSTSPRTNTSTDANRQGTAVTAPPATPSATSPRLGPASASASASDAATGPPSQPGIPQAQHPSEPSPPSTTSAAEIPSADLKPLYDYVQDCRACQIQLTAAKQDAADNALKIGALTHERDAAVTAAKGGGFWLRLRRNAFWLAIGAAGSVGVLCGTGHCR